MQRVYIEHLKKSKIKCINIKEVGTGHGENNEKKLKEKKMKSLK
jgi:hypothetical protein